MRSILLPAIRLTSGLSVGISAVKSTSITVVPFTSSVFWCGLIISVGASSSNMFLGVDLSLRSDQTRSQNDMSLGGSVRAGVDVDGPVSGFFL